MVDRSRLIRRRLDTRTRWCLWALVNLWCTWTCVMLGMPVMDGLRADASAIGTFSDPGARCPERVEYVVDGLTYEVGTGARGWCSREDGDPTSPQRVFYDSDDPGRAVLADPGGTTGTLIVQSVSLTLLGGLTLWLWWRWSRWSHRLLRARRPDGANTA